MTKRKCVRQAIVELSDSEEEGNADDCVIVNSIDHVTASRADCKVDREGSSVVKIGKARTAPPKLSTNEGNSPTKQLGNKSPRKTRVAKKTAVREQETDTKVERRRKRKCSESDDKMGSGTSKKEKRASEFKSEDNEWKQAERFQKHLAEQRQQEERLQKHFEEQRRHEEQRLRKARQEWEDQQLEQKTAASSHKIYPTLREVIPTQRRVSPKAKPLPTDTAETYMARLGSSGVRCAEWTVIDFICEENSIGRHVAENLVKLIDEDNTIPFIARYRKDMTRGMDADELRRVKNSYDRAKMVKQKAATIIKEIDKQGKWTAEFHAFVTGTKSLNDLDQIHSMFKVTKSTLVERAKDVGLGIPAEAVVKSQIINPLNYLVKPNVEGLRNEEQVKDGIVCVIADMINKDRRTFDKVKELRECCTMQIETKKLKTAEKEAEETKSSKHKKVDENNKYDLYHNFSSAEKNMKPHQILAINRGEARKVLSVKVTIPAQFDAAFKDHCSRQYRNAMNASAVHRTLMTAAIDYALNKTVKKSVMRRTRQEMNERAEIASMDVFAENVKQLLLTPPVRGKVVVGVDPGFRHGCKLAVVSEQGDMLETETIYPHDENSNSRHNAERVLVRMVQKHRCTIFAIGNGTGCRETEVFIANLIKNKAFKPIDVVYTIVDETGASIYSCSKEASTEFPNLDVNVVSAVSIARRLQDPMAELVKIEPKHLGVGMYQHDLPEKQLASKLNEVIMEAVSFVGVDVNTASVSLLKRVAGLGDSKANAIINWRKSSGPFTNRNDLMQVRGIGSKTFEQCAGFIRIMPETALGNDLRKSSLINYLDQTWIHPESYDVAKSFLRHAGCDLRQLGTSSFIFAVQLFASPGYPSIAKKIGTTIETIDVIVKGLSMEKGQDIRAKGDVTMFRKSLTSLDDLSVGTALTGVVRNITHFGAFVDVGVERSGLIHKNFMGGMTISVGQRVEVKVNNIEKERGRLGLTLINCL